LKRALRVLGNTRYREEKRVFPYAPPAFETTAIYEIILIHFILSSLFDQSTHFLIALIPLYV